MWLCYVCFQGQNVLTETLLRAQERQRTNQRGIDQPDLQGVPADSSEQRVDDHRARVSSASSDFEPFEVIDEELEGMGSMATLIAIVKKLLVYLTRKEVIQLLPAFGGH